MMATGRGESQKKAARLTLRHAKDRFDRVAQWG
jgi:hypothetical protein